MNIPEQMKTPEHELWLYVYLTGLFGAMWGLQDYQLIEYRKDGVYSKKIRLWEQNVQDRNWVLSNTRYFNSFLTLHSRYNQGVTIEKIRRKILTKPRNYFKGYHNLSSWVKIGENRGGKHGRRIVRMGRKRNRKIR